uniref:Uncharacterized protein n=1 Tax=Leptocylindrus danicus TaxID=163516 RepID=A0A7S2LT75_9STRA|mmetsp:Transcript_9146/g.13669  ORF Transcript_9146/g.13669 Transcript_9146/m.13669 type:complete len:164 (+) Transcript_9146:231-722(+)
MLKQPTASSGPGGTAPAGGRSNRDVHQDAIVRQASILRKNLLEWDYVLHTPARAENWPTMLGRLNAALNQAGNVDDGIEDLLEHFVYLPKKVTANPGDIPVFLSSKLAPIPGMLGSTDDNTAKNIAKRKSTDEIKDEPVKKLQRYENEVANLASMFENSIVRY